MAGMKLKKGDKVVVIAGKDKGKEGTILVVDVKKKRVIVEGINMVSKHTKQKSEEEKGGIVKKENFIDASNVMYLHNGKPTRIGVQRVAKTVNGKEKMVRQRVAKKTGEVID
ncbi:MAG: 50S ribosomal protein L24 [Firmicutes bacterium]|nr:50S ribosomal protein L24 [Bacillota bacterium]MBQ7241764.1 50S ribosomal protein L24 [Bacillota bacterium]MBR0105050.1 50S ribosomal protein L24 [Bacillota bacterium]MBR2594086.1 50S ribosomal protein L24 [Bacillota bacterium]